MEQIATLSRGCTSRDQPRPPTRPACPSRNLLGPSRNQHPSKGRGPLPPDRSPRYNDPSKLSANRSISLAVVGVVYSPAPGGPVSSLGQCSARRYQPDEPRQDPALLKRVWVGVRRSAGLRESWPRSPGLGRQGVHVTGGGGDGTGGSGVAAGRPACRHATALRATHRPSRCSDGSYGPCGPGSAGASRPSTTTQKFPATGDWWTGGG